MTVLRTERLVLRPWRDDDVAPLAEIYADERVWWYPLRRGFTYEETALWVGRWRDAWTTQGWGLWAVERDGRLIGYTGFALPTFLPEVMPVPEIAWRLAPAEWGQGLATEAARAAMAHAFGPLAFDEVVSIYEPENVASGRVMERIGMTFDRATVHPELDQQLRVYRMTAEDWASANAFRSGPGAGEAEHWAGDIRG